MKQNNSMISLEDCLGTVSEERIILIEKKAAIRLPKSFIELVKYCDGGVPIACDFEYFNSAKFILILLPLHKY